MATPLTETYPTYDEAAATCGAGYEDPTLVDVAAYKTDRQADRTQQLLPEQAMNSITAVAIAAADPLSFKPLRVLDFGGGCGFHYVHVTATVTCALRWAVVETPAMASRAAAVSRGRFGVFADIQSAASALGPPDLVHTSGALQYTKDPVDTLRKLVSTRPRYLALLRFPVWGGPTVFAVQESMLSRNGLGPMPDDITDSVVRYPLTMANVTDLLSAVVGYNLIYETEAPSGSYVFAGDKAPGRNFLFRRKQ